MRKHHVGKLKLLKAALSAPDASVPEVLHQFGFPTHDSIACSSCGIVQDRIFRDIKYDRMIYVNNEGLEWRFNRCPSCYRAKMKRSYVVEVPYHADRKCRKCNGPIETSRWFKCLRCLPLLPDDITEDQFLYDAPGYKRPSEMILIPTFGFTGEAPK